MPGVTLPLIGTDTAWRLAARKLLVQAVRPEDVTWHFGQPTALLFEDDPLPEPDAAALRRNAVKVPQAFVDLAGQVVWHSDKQRFARIYAFLWRLRREPGLMADVADPDLLRLRRMEKNVQRCKHKMKAFVRFREIGARDLPRRRFAAWFEPTHHTVEPTAPFFARRFADMDWMIVSPTCTAVHESGVIRFAPGQPKPDLPEDATEDLWGVYFCNIFNPARVKISAMTSEMPKKYWKNLPEARHIPQLIAEAEARVAEMHATAPTLPGLRAARMKARKAGEAASDKMPPVSPPRD